MTEVKATIEILLNTDEFTKEELKELVDNRLNEMCAKLEKDKVTPYIHNVGWRE